MPKHNLPEKIKQRRAQSGETKAAFRGTVESLAAMDFKAVVNNAGPEQLEFLANIYKAQHLQAAFNNAVDLAAIDYPAEKEKFLDSAQSLQTSRAYRKGLERLEAWARPQHIGLLDLTPALADDFIGALRAGTVHNPDTGKPFGKSPATVRITAAAASSFYTWLHRRHTMVENPFRGSRARPLKHSVRPLAIPEQDEVETIVKEIPPQWSCAVALMARYGLRSGALPGLEKKGSLYRVESKGGEYNVALDEAIIKRIKRAGLDPRRPWKGRTANSIELEVAYYINKLYEAGKVKAPYSCHDFRHYAARREYRRTKDPLYVRDFLHHSSVAVTENYLAKLGEIE
jgi:integrase